MRTLSLLSLLLVAAPAPAQTPAPAPTQPKQAAPATPPPPAKPQTPQTPPATTRRAPAAPTGRTGLALTVTGTNGASLEGVHVELSGQSSSSGDTNAGGQVNFPGLQAGTYKLRFTGDSVLGFEREVTLRAGKIENLQITLTPAPPPKIVEKTVTAQAEVPRVGPKGAPQLGSLTNVANREKNTKEARREVLLSCSGNTRNMLLVLTQDQPERLYDSAEATFYVVSGQGNARIGSLQSAIDTGSFVSVPRATPFSFARQGKAPLILLFTLSGEPCEQAR